MKNRFKISGTPGSFYVVDTETDTVVTEVSKSMRKIQLQWRFLNYNYGSKIPIDPLIVSALSEQYANERMNDSSYI